MATEIQPAMAIPQPGKPSLRYGWYVTIVLMLCNTLSFIDRQILGLLVTPWRFLWFGD